MQYSANDFAKYWKSIDDIVIPTKDDLLVNKSYRKAIEQLLMIKKLYRKWFEPFNPAVE